MCILLVFIFLKSIFQIVSFMPCKGKWIYWCLAQICHYSILIWNISSVKKKLFLLGTIFLCAYIFSNTTDSVHKICCDIRYQACLMYYRISRISVLHRKSQVEANAFSRVECERETQNVAGINKIHFIWLFLHSYFIFVIEPYLHTYISSTLHSVSLFYLLTFGHLYP